MEKLTKYYCYKKIKKNVLLQSLNNNIKCTEQYNNELLIFIDKSNNLIKSQEIYINTNNDLIYKLDHQLKHYNDILIEKKLMCDIKHNNLTDLNTQIENKIKIDHDLNNAIHIKKNKIKMEEDLIMKRKNSLNEFELKIQQLKIDCDKKTIELNDIINEIDKIKDNKNILENINKNIKKDNNFLESEIKKKEY